MATIETLKTLRGIIDAKLQRIETFVTKFKSKDTTEGLISRKNTLDSIFAEFNETQTKIELMDPEELKRKVRTDFEDRYHDLSANIEIIFKSKKVPSVLSPGTPVTNPVKSRVKLPEIPLPKFAGTYADWRSYSDTFTDLIGNDSTLTDCMKFHYLKQSLTGEAVKVIENLSISNTDYDSAWKLLENRYNNTRIIVQEHINNILNAPPILKSSSAAIKLLLDTVNASLEALKLLKVPVQDWDSLIIAIMTAKLDYNTNKEWHTTLTRELPKFETFQKFLEERCVLLEAVSAFSNKNQFMNKTVPSPINHSLKSQFTKRTTTSHVSTTNPQKCFHCNNSHFLSQCKDFLNLSNKDRFKRAKELSLCINCLRKNHNTNNCKSSNCRECQKRHHTLLHFIDNNNSSPSEQKTNEPTNNHNSETSASTSSTNHCHNERQQQFQQILLSTAVVLIKGANNQFETCRVLLDVGSQSNFIRKDLCTKLQLSTVNINHTVAGINQNRNVIKESVETVIKSRSSVYESKIKLLVTEKITSDMPLITFKKSLIKIPDNLTLADPNFNINSPIDILLGAELFWDLLIMEQIKMSKNQPIWQNTQLGWVVGGPLPFENNRSSSLALCITDADLEQRVTQFFDIEHCASENQNSQQHLCELHFQSTFERQHDGRFLVKLPFLNYPPKLGPSFYQAKRFLLSLEHKFRQMPELKEKYILFMREYCELGHMEPVLSKSLDELTSNSRCSFLPHHGVFKNSNDKKIRVVFNASQKTGNGLSLNDNLMNGPVVQDELFAILLRFRIYQFVILADITKFYRQINLYSDHCDYHLILWREHEREPIKCFRLKTLTYGTKPASFIASRCLKQLSIESSEQYPLASEVIANDFYMDDLMTGSNNLQEALEIRENITHILSRAQLPICKWSSNDERIVLKETASTADNNDHVFDKTTDLKTLGLFWNKQSDLLKYSVDIQSKSQTATKRTILSLISKIFDPLGLIGPVITLAKILLQKIWSMKLEWDEEVPPEIYSEWSSLLSSLTVLNTLQIPRKVIPEAHRNCIEIHGFADASMKAYGAAIYIRTANNKNETDSYLLCSKSRVAPVKTISLPRLELCAARLLARLYDKVIKSLKNVHISKTVFWSDSTIVLAWLSAPANNWVIFVANRVSEIQQLTNPNNWRHIPGEINPADLISRGIAPEKLISCRLWFNGPDFLSKSELYWPAKKSPNEHEAPEAKNVSVPSTNIFIEHPVFTKFSSFLTLKRVMAFVYRFINNTRNKSFKTSGSLTIGELEQATVGILKTIQKSSFYSEINSLQQGKEIHKPSNILSLDPFLDKHGILRVGGRLKNADINYTTKHQILLPPKHHVTRLIISYEHSRNLHAGTLGTLAAIRQRFWIPNGRSTVRNIIRKCYQCFRARPVAMIQKMGNLPKPRTELIRPFLKTGVDYAGPFVIKAGYTKQCKSIKAFVSLFVCLATKAVHLELVSDLTTECFLNAFRRFISRRGFVTDIFSDNGTNFVGSKNELDEIYNFLNSEQFQEKVVEKLIVNNIDWHFIPPRSPHMGGLWEVNVKSVKRHLKTLVNPDTRFTYEEMYSLLCRIEACLNSRPITPMSSEPQDLDFLTPGHFLIGDYLTAPVDLNIMDIKLNRLSRWQMIERIRQQFWKKWSREYLTTLQNRAKWHRQNKEIKIGSMVILIEDNLPPQMWRLGRITQTHPGSDNIIRVVTVKTRNGDFKRSVHKIAPLPMDNNETE